MRVVITGASGLIGTKLTNLLDQESIDWIGLSRSTSGERFVSTDYRVKSLSGILSKDDVIVHLAAVRGRDAKNGYQDYVENEVLTEHLLQAMVKTGASKIIFLSSISVYSDPALLPWREDIRPQPVSFYGLSKLVCEYLCERYQSQGIQSTIFRCAHVLGFEDRGYMLSKFLNGAANHETLTVMGKSVARREFVYVKDVARAVLWALRVPERSKGIFNLGCGQGTTNLCLAEEINSVFRNEGNLRYLDSTDEGISDSYMDVSRLQRAGFALKYTMRSALEDIREETF